MSLICSLIIEFPPPTGGDLQDWRVLKGSSDNIPIQITVFMLKTNFQNNVDSAFVPFWRHLARKWFFSGIRKEDIDFFFVHTN